MTPAERTQRNLARAVQLDAKALEHGRYEITGGSEPHVVDVRARSCDCADFMARGGSCKHIFRALLAVGDPLTLAALRALVPEPKRGKTPKSAGQQFDPGMPRKVAAQRHLAITGASR